MRRALTRWCGLSVTLLALPLLEGAARGDAAHLTPDQRARLARGEILSQSWRVPGRDVGTGWAMGLVEGAPERVFAVIADVERYPSFMSRMTAARIIGNGAGHYDFYYAIDMPWPLSDLWSVTRNVHQVDARRQRYRRRWTLLRGTFIHNEGYWLVERWSEGWSLLTYSVTLRPKMSVPDGVLDYASKKALPRSVRQVRDRVRALARARTAGQRSPMPASK